MGAAKLIELVAPDGRADGHALEMRALLDGSLILRVIEPGRRAGIGMPGSAATAELARSLAHNHELMIRTMVGLYTFQREQNRVRVSYFQFEDSWLRTWTCDLSNVLSGLRDLLSKAA